MAGGPEAALRVIASRPGRTASERRVVFAGPDGHVAAHGLWCDGGRATGGRRWADLVVVDLSVLPAIVTALGPGSAVMVAYGGDATERGLRRKVPPAASVVGLALLRAGCRWFKDWYFAEGGREGGTKLQGTVPLDDDARSRAEHSLIMELRTFLGRPQVDEADRCRARTALELLIVPSE